LAAEAVERSGKLMGYSRLRAQDQSRNTSIAPSARSKPLQRAMSAASPVRPILLKHRNTPTA